MRARTTTLGVTLGMTLGMTLATGCGGDNEGDDGESRVRLMPAAALTEGSGDFQIVAQRTGDARQALTVEVVATDISAKAGEDYQLSAPSLSWAAGDSADKIITVTVTDDLTIESDETFSIGVRGMSDAGQTLTLLDNDRVGEVLAVTSQGRLVSFDRGSANVLRHGAELSGLSAGEVIVGLDVRPRDGKLYALTNQSKLYTVDAATGKATVIYALAADANDATEPFTALSGTRFGIDFNPVVDRLRVVSDTGQNLRIDVDLGRVITDGSLRGATAGVAAAGYLNSHAEACRTRLFGLDLASSRLVVQDPPNDGVTTAIGAGLGVTASAGFFDVLTAQDGTSSGFAVLNASGESGLYSIDLTTGAAARLGMIALSSGETATSMALTPPKLDGPVTQAAGELYAVTEGGKLISFNRAAPAKTCTSAAISGLGASETIADLDVRPSTGLVYALAVDGTAGALYTVNPTSGAASNRAALSVALSGSTFGIDFNPTGPVALRIVSDAGQNLRVTDLAAGTTVVDGAINGASTSLTSAAYTNSLAGAATTALYTLDPSTDRLRLQTPPNAGTQVDVGALGLDVAAIEGFDIDGRDNVAFVALVAAGSTKTSFHTLDLSTGALSASLGSFATRLRGLSRLTPTTTVYALLEGGSLVTISPADPSTPTVIGAVTGLALGEALHDLDFRPSTGLLYGLGTLGGLYELNPTTAAATRVASLAADATDLSVPFTGLLGSGVGIDFNPTGPVALRVVSDAEENLRIPNLSTGATITDTSLNLAGASSLDVRAAAYTNSFPGALTTTLYTMDLASGSLMIQAPPNDGVLTAVGPLSTTRTFSAAAFDIAGGANGVALAALRTAGGAESFSRLYRVDLATGAATELGGGIGSGAAVRGLAIRVR